MKGVIASGSVAQCNPNKFNVYRHRFCATLLGEMSGNLSDILLIMSVGIWNTN